jgi:hypothetical protein
MSQKLQTKDNSFEKIKRRRKQTNLSPEERLVNQRHRSVPFKSALLLLIENRHLKEKHLSAAAFHSVEKNKVSPAKLVLVYFFIQHY